MGKEMSRFCSYLESFVKTPDNMLKAKTFQQWVFDSQKVKNSIPFAINNQQGNVIRPFILSSSLQLWLAASSMSWSSQSDSTKPDVAASPCELAAWSRPSWRWANPPLPPCGGNK